MNNWRTLQIVLSVWQNVCVCCSIGNKTFLLGLVSETYDPVNSPPFGTVTTGGTIGQFQKHSVSIESKAKIPQFKASYLASGGAA